MPEINNINKTTETRDRLAKILYEIDCDLTIDILLKSEWKYYEIEEYFLHPEIFK